MNNDFIACRSCVNKPGPRPGFYYDTYNGYEIIKECSCHIAWRREVTLKQKTQKANIWYTDEAKKYNPETDYVGTRSLDSVQKLRSFVDNSTEIPECLSSIVYMYGPYGTQKTYLAHWVGLELLKRKVSVKYVMMNTLIKLLSDSLPSPEHDAQIQQLRDVDVLIIDEAFQKEKMTIYKSGYQLPFIEIFIRERVDQYKKGIIFISNVLPTAIQESGMSQSLQDFIVRNVTKMNTLLPFEDNFIKLNTQVNPIDIFKKRT